MFNEVLLLSPIRSCLWEVSIRSSSVPIFHFIPRRLCLMTPVGGSLGKGDHLAPVSLGFSRIQPKRARSIKSKRTVRKHLQVGADEDGSWNRFPEL